MHKVRGIRHCRRAIGLISGKALLLIPKLRHSSLGGKLLSRRLGHNQAFCLATSTYSLPFATFRMASN